MLELNRIGFDRGQIWVEQSLYVTGLKHGIGVYHACHICYKIVQIHPLPVRGGFFYHALEAANHISGAATISHDVTEEVMKFAKIDISTIDKALSRACVAGDSRERLIQFMGNGCRQLTHRGHATKMTELVALLFGFEFRLFSRSDVDANSQESRWSATGT